MPRQQLLGQHREGCALRVKVWQKTNATVNYIFKYEPYLLHAYHLLIMNDMTNRGYNVSKEWYDKNYRGKVCPAYTNLKEVSTKSPTYPEYNDDYYQEYIENLRQKGIFIIIFLLLTRFIESLKN